MAQLCFIHFLLTCKPVSTSRCDVVCNIVLTVNTKVANSSGKPVSTSRCDVVCNIVLTANTKVANSSGKPVSTSRCDVVCNIVLTVNTKVANSSGKPVSTSRCEVFRCMRAFIQLHGVCLKVLKHSYCQTKEYKSKSHDVALTVFR